MRLTKAQAKLIQWERVARVATVARRACRTVPVCQLLLGGKITSPGKKAQGPQPPREPEAGATVDLC
jgi:hypothetical protein